MLYYSRNVINGLGPETEKSQQLKIGCNATRSLMAILDRLWLYNNILVHLLLVLQLLSLENDIGRDAIWRRVDQNEHWAESGCHETECHATRESSVRITFEKHFKRVVVTYNPIRGLVVI